MNQNTQIFAEENPFENVVCKLKAILIRTKCVETFGRNCRTWGSHLVNFMIMSQLEAETKLSRFRRRHFQMHFLNKNVCISLKISMKFVPKVRINSIPALVQIMAWCRPGNKPLSEPMMVNLLMYIRVTLP